MPDNLHNIIREKNGILNQWEQYVRKEKLESYPLTIQFPTGSHCNLRCIFCTEREGEKAKKQYDNCSFKDFRELTHEGRWKQALSSSKLIRLYGWGEPLFNSDYEKIFDFITGNFPGLGVCISSNGILFNKKWSKKFISTNRSEINFSVNAATKETYYKMTGSKKFEHLISNISNLIKLREKSQTKNPFVSLSYVVTTENVSELVQFVDLAADIKVDCICFQDITLFNKKTESLSLMNKPKLAREMFKKAEKRAREQKIQLSTYVSHQVDYFSSEEQTKEEFYPSLHDKANDEVPSPYLERTDCFEPWINFMVDGGGEVYPCCHYGSITGASPDLIQEEFGNVFKQDFIDIWNGEGYKEFRRNVNTTTPPYVCSICPIKTGAE